MIKLVGPVLINEFQHNGLNIEVTIERRSGRVLSVIKERIGFPEELMISLGTLAEKEYNYIMIESLVG